MSADQIRVHFGALDNAVSDLNAGANAMNQRMSQLQSDIQPMVSTWSGGAQQSYHSAQKQWDQGWQELAAALQQLQRATGQANDGYNAGEQANISRFGG